MGNSCCKEKKRTPITPARSGVPDPRDGSPPSLRNFPRGRSGDFTRPVPIPSATSHTVSGRSIQNTPQNPSPNVRPSQTPQPILYKALYDFVGRTENELTFHKDATFRFVHDRDKDRGFLFLQHEHTKREGYVPENFVQQLDNRPEHQEWFHDISRYDAERKLLTPDLKKGTFCIRPGSQSCYALSLRHVDERGRINPRHYRIRKMDNGQFYIGNTARFDSLQELVNFYSNRDDHGLCTRLTFILDKDAPRPPNLFQMKIPFTDIRIINEVARGCFGVVYKGKWGQTDTALKVMKPGTMSEEKFLDEARIMHKLNHERLVQLMGICYKDTPREEVYIVTEWMNRGNSLDFVRNQEFKERPEQQQFNQMIDIIADVASGMEFIEKAAFIHRDLRAQNVLINIDKRSFMTAKICDFGLSKALTEDVYNLNQDTKFPIKWTAPEAAQEGTHDFTIKSDVWSFGIFCYEIITHGKIPYPGMNGHQVQQQVRAGYRIPKSECRSDVFRELRFGDAINALYNILERCWDQHPLERPTFEYLASFFTNFQCKRTPQYDGFPGRNNIDE